VESAEQIKIPKSRRVTIEDIAEMAGVSTATVSNVVNSRGSASESTRAKVIAVIGVLNWTPDQHARELAQCRRDRRLANKAQL
jgi:DNA-binding LacI/PurR family transcriptional regulator